MKPGVGIATHEELRKRALEIAEGKRKRKPVEPRFWFTSQRALARYLLDSCCRFLRRFKHF